MSEFIYQTLRESIVSAIRMKILNQELVPGTRIVEQKLAEEFHASRGPIREALRQLEQEGLVEYSRNVGCSARTITPDDVYEIYMLRANYECAALRHYDCDFTQEELDAFGSVLEQMQQLSEGDLAGIVDCDNRFHRILIDKAGLPRLKKYWEELNYGSLVVGFFSSPHYPSLAKRQYPLHRQLLDILAARDPERACTALMEHYMQPLEAIMPDCRPE